MKHEARVIVIGAEWREQQDDQELYDEYRNAAQN